VRHWINGFSYLHISPVSTLSQHADAKVNYWGKKAFDHFLDLYHGADAGEAGVQLMTAYQLLEEHEAGAPLPAWRDIVFNFTDLPSDELQKMNIPHRFVRGFSFGTLVVEQKRYMTYMTRKLRAMGVKFVAKKVSCIHSLLRTSNYASAGGSGPFDIVVNCSGLGAYHLSKDDSMYPIRGQIVRVQAPWVKNVWFFGSSYIIPNLDCGRV
jgi:hypothetical protein